MLTKIRSLAPGVARATAVGASGLLASTFVPLAPVPLALFIGALVPASLIGSDSKPGLSFCATNVLRAGVVCVGFKMNLGELATLGVVGAPCVAASVALGLYAIPKMAARANLEPRLGQLLAIGTSICGVTAISALAPVIKAREEEIGLAVSNVVVWGAAGMIMYPFLAHWMFAGSATQIGLFLGLAVHDTSQVMGAAATYASTFGNAAVLKAAAVTKLTRNICLAGALPYLASFNPLPTGSVPRLTLSSFFNGVPRFVVLFVCAAGVRTIGDVMLGNWPVWVELVSVVADVAPKMLLGLAMAAVGLQISPMAIAKAGIKPFVVGGAAAMLVAVTGLTAATFIGVFVK